MKQITDIGQGMNFRLKINRMMYDLLFQPSEVYDHAGVIRSHDVITVQTPEGIIETS